MSSKVLFNKIMATNLLVSMSGVIPSYSSFQFMLCSRVEAFNLALQGEGHTRNEIDALLRLICHISGLLTQKQGSNTSSLSTYFYPKVEGNVFTLQHHHLLMRSGHPDINYYIQTLSTLCPSSLPVAPAALTAQTVEITNVRPPPGSEVGHQKRQSGDIFGQLSDKSSGNSLRLNLGIAFVVLTCIWAGCYGYLAAGL